MNFVIIILAVKKTDDIYFIIRHGRDWQFWKINEKLIDSDNYMIG
jgi:hypothetical protein